MRRMITALFTGLLLAGCASVTSIPTTALNPAGGTLIVLNGPLCYEFGTSVILIFLH